MGLGDLFKPKWKHSNYIKRRKAVMELDDQEILIDIVKNDPADGIRKAAIKKIKDKDFLLDIAKNEDEDWSVRLEASIQCNYNPFLVDFVKFKILIKDKQACPDARSRAHIVERKEAIKHITDIAALCDIAYNSTYDEKSTHEKLNMSKVVGYSDHDGYEYERVKVSETSYPLREAAKERLKELGYG